MKKFLNIEEIMGKFIDFADFKNVHLGKTAILFGSGPSVKEFDFSSITDEIILGVNECIFLETELDYLFVRDFRNSRVRAIQGKLDNYQARIAKLVGKDGSIADGSIKGCKFYQAQAPGPHRKRAPFFEDGKKKIAVYGSTSLDAMQFILWTGVKKVYLVGHDCDYGKGTFKNPGQSDKKGPSRKLLDHWKKLKSWSEKVYPDVEIFVVNPRALKCFPEGSIK